MNKIKKNSQDQLNVMRKIGGNPNLSQRDLAEELGFSLGKLNYCLKELKLKGFVKMNNFKRSKNKITVNAEALPNLYSSKANS